MDVIKLNRTYLCAFGCALAAATAGRNICHKWDTGNPGCVYGRASNRPASRRKPWNSADNDEPSCLAAIYQIIAQLH